jgi:hypothetical protein
VADTEVADVEVGGVEDSAGGDGERVFAAVDPADEGGAACEGAVDGAQEGVVANISTDADGGGGQISACADELILVGLEIEGDVVLIDGELGVGDVGGESDGVGGDAEAEKCGIACARDSGGRPVAGGVEGAAGGIGPGAVEGEGGSGW